MKYYVFLIFLVFISDIECSNRTRSRFRRREFVEEQVRKTMLNYMTSLKGEIADIVLDDLINYYGSQKVKLEQMEHDLSSLKNTASTTELLTEQQNLAVNLSMIDHKLKNLSKTLSDLFHSLETTQATLPTDCDDVRARSKISVGRGVFRIKPHVASTSFDVLCLFENRTTWTILQQRFNGSVDFFRSWSEYKTGFGNFQTEFWLGNDRIHQLTRQNNYSLRIDLQAWNKPIVFAEYKRFAIGNEDENYKLHIEDFDTDRSTAGDSLNPYWDSANGAAFSTYDRDNDRLFYDNCALIYHSAWWFTNCFQSHLNGLYIQPPLAFQNKARNGLQWNTYDLYHSMKSTTIRIRRSN